MTVFLEAPKRSRLMTETTSARAFWRRRGGRQCSWRPTVFLEAPDVAWDDKEVPGGYSSMNKKRITC
jgi:hypothetical protein